MQQAARRTTIADVARAAGVSKAAVSFAFNTPERLSPDTVSRIRDTATALEYRPDPVARMLAHRRTGTIGILTPQALEVIFTNPYFALFAAGVAAAVEDAGYALQFISPLHGSLIRAVDRASVDGVIAVGLAADHPEVGQVRRAGVPFVLVDSTALPDEPNVIVDDEGGARAAADHLLHLGHKAFLVLAIDRPTADGAADGATDAGGVTDRRLDAYRAALTASSVALDEADIVLGPPTIEGGYEAFRTAWARGRRPTAVLAMADAMAIGVLHATRELGIRVPAELSVVGFDDIELAPYVDPPLTTVHQPIQRKGEEAVRLLLAALDRRHASRLEHFRLETRLVVRASTGRAPRRRQEGRPPKA